MDKTKGKADVHELLVSVFGTSEIALIVNINNGAGPLGLATSTPRHHAQTTEHADSGVTGAN
jgi:hypothetical protein